MAEAAPSYQQHEDFWKPLPNAKLHSVTVADTSPSKCPRCQVDLLTGVRFCHTCGFDQETEQAKTPSLFDLASAANALDQSLGSLIALILGCACLIAAVATGFLFKVSTLADWQAVQLWRIEWLLGAIALFAAGLVLRRRPAHRQQ